MFYRLFFKMDAKIRLYQFNYRFNTDLTILLQYGKMKGEIWLDTTCIVPF